MTKKRISLVVFICFLGVIFGFFYNIYRISLPNSQASIPGTYPIDDQEHAIMVGRTVANTDAAPDFDKGLIKVQEARLLNQAEFVQRMKDSGDIIEASALLGSDANNDIWLVTFNGLFAPRRLPAGIEGKPYTKLDVFLKASDGSVIGIKMHD